MHRRNAPASIQSVGKFPTDASSWRQDLLLTRGWIRLKRPLRWKLYHLHRASEGVCRRSSQPHRRQFPLSGRPTPVRRHHSPLPQARTDPSCRPLGLLRRRKLWSLPRHRPGHNVCRLSGSANAPLTRLPPIQPAPRLSHPAKKTYRKRSPVGDSTARVQHLVRPIAEAGNPASAPGDAS